MSKLCRHWVVGGLMGASLMGAGVARAAEAAKDDTSKPATSETTTEVKSSSAAGDYIGDCFGLKGNPDVNDEGARTYLVTEQKELDNDDRRLTVVPGKIKYFPLRCVATSREREAKLASELIAQGATRSGYAYGVLTMPYKYFPGEKSFTVNAPVGGYMGWRHGRAGSGTTYAVAFTLSSVKANTVDPSTLVDNKPAVTGTAQVAAISFAAGVMFDVLKSTRGKPFKTGLFIGRDRVSQDPTVDYRFNGKTWVALQIGFDFTDN